MVQRLVNLLDILNKNRSTFLFGPRGTGKTALLRELFSTGLPGEIINLLHSELFRRYKLNPSQFRKDVERKINSQPPPVTIAVDEVQKIPELLDEVHSLLEEYKGQLRFILTGSSARKLKRGGANLLAGRALTSRLHPLSMGEIRLELERALTIGTLPGIYLDDQDPLPLLEAYVDTYVREEILQEAIIRKVDPFLRFLDVAAQSNGESLNFAKLARAAAVSPHTVASYFQILEDTMLGALLPPFHFSVRRQIVQSPRFYFFDCGVLNQLRGELRSALKPSSYRFGKLFETFVINELLRANDYRHAGQKLYYWRTSTGMEVALVLSKSPAFPPTAIEIKSDTAPARSDCRGLLAFQQENPKARLLLISRTPKPYNIGEISVLPWDECLPEVFRDEKSSNE